MGYFERLSAVVERVANHPDFPGKQETLDLCLEDIEGLSLDGLITPEQQDVLREVLLGATSHVA
jgi:hypothetical protein